MTALLRALACEAEGAHKVRLAPGSVEPLCCIASPPHARSPGPRGFSLSLKHKVRLRAARKGSTCPHSPASADLPAGGRLQDFLHGTQGAHRE
jgi:hypothetical protein